MPKVGILLLGYIIQLLILIIRHSKIILSRLDRANQNIGDADGDSIVPSLIRYWLAKILKGAFILYTVIINPALGTFWSNYNSKFKSFF